MLRASFRVLALLSIVAFTAKPIEPTVSEKPPQPVLQKATQKGEMKEYLCKDDKIIRIVFHTTKHKKNKARSISLTFNNVTYKLSPTIAENGRNYANIHWVWLERKDVSTLKTSVGEVLAEQCVPR